MQQNSRMSYFVILTWYKTREIDGRLGILIIDFTRLGGSEKNHSIDTAAGMFANHWLWYFVLACNSWLFFTASAFATILNLKFQL